MTSAQKCRMSPMARRSSRGSNPPPLAPPALGGISVLQIARCALAGDPFPVRFFVPPKVNISSIRPSPESRCINETSGHDFLPPLGPLPPLRPLREITASTHFRVSVSFVGDPPPPPEKVEYPSNPGLSHFSASHPIDANPPNHPHQTPVFARICAYWHLILKFFLRPKVDSCPPLLHPVVSLEACLLALIPQLMDCASGRSIATMPA